MQLIILVFSLTLFVLLLLFPRSNFKFWRKAKGGTWYKYESTADGRRFWLNMEIPEDEYGNTVRFKILKQETYGDKEN